ncbi:MAG TPA: bifunctional ADP-dependent NAD(P)H-hydrate dehydratase/NAD(P)H-hydrate epimerase [Lachnoclostridium phytofermentans]|uniref:Bifunctional NAD(P)H-hydrate repair enzyme n=2 Tax=Lachnoclostridium TaxID=1506553 RepID=A0A3D2X640_9FIRM|nr:bifunctional ADP-dependent NAD(P)H-hydrate dehydratase/NAD(P)H-hydrate epimerase [Lachnoclostridium phytofermentans]
MEVLMRYALDAVQMKNLDKMTIEQIGIPAMVLMERAALYVAEQVKEHAKQTDKIIAVCGTGNNGGDGIAAARILHLWGYNVTIGVIGEFEKFSKECREQWKIAKNLGLSIRTEWEIAEYNIVIDGIFGIGLSKPVSGEYAKVIQSINQSDCYVVSVDIPSGVNASDGQVFCCAVKANETVTFGEQKLGLLLYPGATYAGKVHIADIGFAKEKLDSLTYTYYEAADLDKLPERMAYSNKGSYGRVLVIAGTENMTGAAYFSAAAAYHMGAGLVKILTAKKAIPVLQGMLPEALFAAYDEENSEEQIKKALEFATVIVIGPGLSTEDMAKKLLLKVCKEARVPLIVDADGINLLAKLADEMIPEVSEMTDEVERFHQRIHHIMDILPKGTILTPHLKELSRLTLYPLNKIPCNLIDIAGYCTYNNLMIYVLKDSRTIVASKDLRYINVSGTHGMATGGSGDVLTGIIAGLIAGGLEAGKAATLGVYLHGLAGEEAAKVKSTYSMLAGDIIGALPEVLRNHDGRNV